MFRGDEELGVSAGLRGGAGRTQARHRGGGCCIHNGVFLELHLVEQGRLVLPRIRRLDLRRRQTVQRRGAPIRFRTVFVFRRERAMTPAPNRGKSRVFRGDGEFGVSAGLRGGAGRTLTCNQIVMNGMLQSPAAGNFLIRPAQTQQQR